MSQQNFSEGKVKRMAEAIDNELKKSRIEEWIKHHEHAAEFLDDSKVTGGAEPKSSRSSKSQNKLPSSRMLSRRYQYKRSSRLGQVESDLIELVDSEDDYTEDEDWQLVSEHESILKDEEEEEEEMSSFKEAEDDDDVEEIEEVLAIESADKTSEDGLMQVRFNSLKENEITVDVAAVAAMVGGFACAIFYAWRGQGKSAKESLEIFSRGFGKMCDKM